MAHLITGFAGKEHIQSADDGAFNASFFGEGQFVMEQGSQFEASIINNNTVRVLDGNGLMYGRHFRINPNEYEDMTIETGTAGTNRIDLIVMTYEKDANDGTETAYLQVIKGTASSGTPVVPSYTNGNILEGATKNQMPLYKVKIEGVVLSDIESLFTTIPTYKTLADEAYAKYIAKLEALQGSDLLDTMEEIEANTQSLKFAGALAVKELNSDLSDISTVTEQIVKDVNNYSLVFRKYGKVVNCYVETWFDIASLSIPSGFRPKKSFQTSGCCSNSGWKQYLANISINFNGTFTVNALTTYGGTEYTTLTSGKVRFSASWIID